MSVLTSINGKNIFQKMEYKISENEIIFYGK